MIRMGIIIMRAAWKDWEFDAAVFSQSRRFIDLAKSEKPGSDQDARKARQGMGR
jgi:hypothetical protein